MNYWSAPDNQFNIVQESEKLFDLGLLSANLNANQAVQQELIRAFIDTAGEALPLMESQLRQGLQGQYRLQAHKLYPSLRLMGMDWAADTLEQISGHLKAGAFPASLLTVFMEFRLKMERTFKALETELK